MSLMVPQALTDVLRSFNDTSVELYGVPCRLYVPTNLDAIKLKDIYAEPADYEFNQYDTSVFIPPTVNRQKLAKLGLFVEDDALIAYMSNNIKDAGGFKVHVEITIKSWISVPIQYVDRVAGYEEFEIINPLVTGMHDAVATQLYKIAPRRVKNSG
jgi:hypothetical protein